MDLVVVKSGVTYGHTGAAVITSLANVNTLAEGSVLAAFENGTVILASGATQGGALAGSKGLLFYKRDGVVRKTTPIDVATARLISPLGDDAPVAQVQLISASLPAVVDELKYTGVAILDNHMSVYDKGREVLANVEVDADTVKADYLAALVLKIKEHPKVANCVNAAGTLTITMVAGANLSIIGVGYLEGTKGTTTGGTALSYGTLVTAEELALLATQVSASDGNYSNHMDGAAPLFNKTYGIEAGVNYNVWAIESKAKAGYTANDADVVPNIVYIAIPNGQEASGNEGYLDVLNALCGNIGDTAATGGIGEDLV